MKKIGKYRLDIVLCLLLVILILAFLNKGVQMKGVFFGADEVASDLLHLSYPDREYWAVNYLKQSTVALWNPYLASGMPLLAEAQTGIFYPVAVLLYYFLSPPVAFNWLIISSFLLIAVGTYFYCRKIGLKSWAAFLSAAVFSLSGSMVGHLRHVPVITTVAFMPWMFLAAEGILDGGLFWGIALAFLTAFSFFGGHLTSTYLILFVLVIYFLLRLWRTFKVRGKESLRPVILFALSLFGGVMLAMVQLLPSLELTEYSTRAQGAAYTFGVPYFWKYLLMFLNPYILGDPSRATWNMNTGNYWENLGYLGIIPLLLCLLTFLFWQRKKDQVGPALKIGFILTLVLTLGFLTPVYIIFLNWVPGASFTRNSGRFLLFVDFFGAVLAGFGWQMVSSRLKKGNLRFLILGLLILLSVADLFYFGYPFNTVMPLEYFSQTQSAKFLKGDNSLFRIYSDAQGYWQTAWKQANGWRGSLLPYMAQREGLPTDLNLVYRLYSTSLIYSLSGQFSVNRSGELEAFVMSTGFQQGGVRLAKLLGMENIKYFLSTGKLNIPGLKLVKTIQTADLRLKIRIYRNEKFLPRAYLVGKALSFTSTNDLLSTMLYGNFQPQKEVLLEGKTAGLRTSGKGSVRIASYLATKVTIDVNSKDGGYLVLSDTNYPGWKAYIDGKETRIYQADYDYRAIIVPPGRRYVVFLFDPLSFRLGAVISLGALITTILIAGGVMLKKGKRRKKGRFPFKKKQ